MAELGEMRRLVEEAMRDGALGLSSSLIVPPDTYLTTRQLIELAKEVKPYGGIYSTHIRGEGDTIRDAILEAIEIGERAQVPVDIIHLKIADKRMWGKMKEICDLIETARQRGQKVTANQYPYIAGQNYLMALIPPWALEGGKERLKDRLKDAALRQRMEQDILRGLPGWFDHYVLMKGWESAVVASIKTEKNKKYGEIRRGNCGDEREEAHGRCFRSAVGRGRPDSDGVFPDGRSRCAHCHESSLGIDRFRREAVRSDGILGHGRPHPRWYGTFPRILGKYVREQNVLTLEQAINKMTLLNAEKLGISDRGQIATGQKADVTIFDARRVIDRATFENPHQYPEGIEYVIVNGMVVIDRGQHLNVKPGRILYGKGRKAG